jgi:hypothetical protein
MSEKHEHVIDTGKGSFGLEHLGAVLPGMAEVMPLIGDRIWKCYYAGKAGNQALARFQLKEAVNLMEKGVFLRPKYADDIDAFINVQVAAVKKAIESADWAAFEAAFADMVDSANAYHDQYDKPFLQWEVPSTPPPGLRLDPRA